MLERFHSLPLRVRYRLAPLFDKCPGALWGSPRRRIQVYGVGMPRSGTVSLHDVFRERFRSAHEPESRFLTHQVVAWRLGRLGRAQMLASLQRRDRRLGLELDSSYLNGEIVELLAEQFPQARFVLTLRDCVSWVDSMTSFLLNKPQFLSAESKPHIREHMELQFGAPPYHYSPHEAVLQSRGLHPLGRYLAYWSEHNGRVIAALPPERLVVVRTREIGASSPRLEAFLGLAPGSLPPATHSNAAPARHSLVAQIDRGFLREQVHEHCGALMRQYFPQVLDGL